MNDFIESTNLLVLGDTILDNIKLINSFFLQTKTDLFALESETEHIYYYLASSWRSFAAYQL